MYRKMASIINDETMGNVIRDSTKKPCSTKLYDLLVLLSTVALLEKSLAGMQRLARTHMYAVVLGNRLPNASCCRITAKVDDG